MLHPPLLPVRRQQSPLPGLHPTPAACPPPPLHTCWGQGGQSSPPPFPFASRPLCPGCSPFPPSLRATRRTHALPLCMHASEAQGTVPPPPPLRPEGPPHPADPFPPPLGGPP